MKVASLETFPVSVPYRSAEHSARVHRGGVSEVVVKLKTDTGLVGWGESCSGADTRSIEAAVRAMEPFILGRDPWETEAIARDVYRTGLWDYRIATGNFAYAGIDMALWDLCGKDCGQPIYRLFGGAMRTEVDYFYYLNVGTADELAEQCRDGVRRGYHVFYLKVGVDAAHEEAMLESIRKTIGPQRRIRIDANEAWSLPEAVRLLNHWHEHFDLDMAEAPVKAFPNSLMKELRLRVPVAICANEGLGSEADVVRMVLSGAVDSLCFSSYWVGSLRRFHALSHLANWHDIRVCKHTHGELGIAAAAGHHIMLTLPNPLDGSQQTAAMLVDDIVEPPLPISQGPRWGLIEAAGLGIDINEEKLRRYNDLYHGQGQFLPYSA